MHLVDFALQGGRAAQSPQTGFVHYYYGKEKSEHTIPVLENALFALALFRSRLADNVLEGKELLLRLLAFQTDSGNFPVYLHQFPVCYDRLLGVKLIPPLYWIYKEFQSIIGNELGPALKRLMDYCQQQEGPNEWMVLVSDRETKMCANKLVAMQMQGKPIDEEATAMWHPALRQSTGDSSVLYQLFMHYLTGDTIPLSRTPHPCHLQAALIRPVKEKISCPEGPKFLKCQSEKGTQLFYPEGDVLLKADSSFTIHLDKEVIMVLDTFETTEILVNGKRATTFRIGDRVTTNIGWNFTIDGDEGFFMGHIAQAVVQEKVMLFDLPHYTRRWVFTLRNLAPSPCHIVKNLA